MSLVDIDRPWINAIVPTVGFWLSTLSLDAIRPIYLRCMFGAVMLDKLSDPQAESLAPTAAAPTPAAPTPPPVAVPARPMPQVHRVAEQRQVPLQSLV